MSETILLITFTLNASTSEYEQIVSPLANTIADVVGLRWKIWLINAVQSEAGGIYLFDDEASAHAYLASAVVDELQRHPALSAWTVKQFDVIEAVTAITHGPVRQGIRV